MTYGVTATTATPSVNDCFQLNADGSISNVICATSTAPFICRKECVYCSVEAKDINVDRDVGSKVEAGKSVRYEC